MFFRLYSEYDSLMIKEYISKKDWCKTFGTHLKTYDIHIFRSVIHDFCLRLQCDENSTRNKSCSSSSLLRIHDGIPPKVIH